VSAAPGTNSGSASLAARPLAGKTVVVTRPRGQAASLAGGLEGLGAEVLLLPTIRIVPRPLDDEVVRIVVNDLGEYRLVVFTSVNGASIFLGYLRELGLPAASLAGAAVAAIGPATAAALEAGGVTCDVVPDDYIAEGLLAALEARGVAPAGARVLIPRAREARSVLPDTLRERGALVDVLAVYDTQPAEGLALPVERVEGADYITFTSSSTVRQFAALMEAAGPAAAGRVLATRLSGARLCSIGPVTSATLVELGLPVAVEAAEYTAAGLLTAIAADVAPRGPSA
jgi:uroporphyrinogen III methyltransferase/synthase